MSLDPTRYRLGPRRAQTPIRIDREEVFGAPDERRWSAPGESTHDAAEQAFDEALEQIVLDKCITCPLCGTIVDRDGTVLS